MGKHHNKKDLLLVQLTQEKFPQYEPYCSNPMDAMRLARTDADREIHRMTHLRSSKRKRKIKISKRSRKVNQG